MGEKEICDHKWVFKGCSRKAEVKEYNNHYISVDFYYCEKCLEQKEVVREEYSRKKPMWFI